MTRLRGFGRLSAALGLMALAGAIQVPAATAQTAAGVDAEAPIVAPPRVEPGVALYDVSARASADQPQDRFHLTLRFCDTGGACESVASVTDASGDDKRTTQTWPDASRGVPSLTVALGPEEHGTLTAVWEIYTFYDRVWHPDWDFTHESPPVPIGPAGGPGTGGGAGGGGATGGGGGSDAGGDGEGPGGGGGKRTPRMSMAPAGAGRVAVTVVCEEPCRVRAALSIGPRAARRLKLRSAVIGRLDARVSRAGRRKLILHVNRRVGARLRRAGRTRIRAVARGRVVERSGARAGARRGLTVRL